MLNRDGSYVYAVPSDCPDPDSTVICPAVALPVLCGECQYINQCRATSADPGFTSETCTLVNA